MSSSRDGINIRFIPTGVGNAPLRDAAKSIPAVHPHGCGERGNQVQYSGEGGGSSPRVWGTLSGWDEMRQRFRFIPTGVGNAIAQQIPFAPHAVHPHGCGERDGDRRTRRIKAGSSPRVWGTPRKPRRSPYRGRFIPTGVGNATQSTTCADAGAVHPHGCGERRLEKRKNSEGYGSSPRVWGTPENSGVQRAGCRFIPTGVGNASIVRYREWYGAVHPHGCGERANNNRTDYRCCGSSPRVWGTPIPVQPCPHQLRFIPTGVGNAVLMFAIKAVAAVHPHGCGERIANWVNSRL